MGEGVWIVAEREGERLSEATFEIVWEGLGLAKYLKTEIVGIVIGCDVDTVAEELRYHGSSRVYLVEHELLANLHHRWIYQSLSRPHKEL